MAKIPIGGGGDDGTSINIPRVVADQSTIVDILSVVYFWAGIVAVIVLIVAGFFYVTANGNAQTIERAKNAIVGGIVGLLVVIFAFAITQLVIMFAQSA